MVVPWDQVKKHMHVQTPLDKRRAAGVDLPDRKDHGRTEDPEPESRRDGQVPGQAEAGAARQALAEVPGGFRRRIMRTGSWRRSLSVPTGNRSAAIRREMPWARERPETGVQAARAIGQAAGRVQTAQARKTGGGRRETIWS